MDSPILTSSEYEKILAFYELTIQSASPLDIHQSLKEIFNFNSTVIWSISPHALLTSPSFFNIPQQAINEYITFYQTLDILHPQKLNFSQNKKIYLLNDILPWNKYLETEFYQDFMKKHGYYHEMGVYLFQDNLLKACIGIVRTKDEPPFSQKDVTYFKYLLPPLSKCLIKESKNDFNQICLHYGITKKEKEIIQFVMKGYTNREIAKLFYVSENTIKKHMQNIFQKMEVNNRTSLCSMFH